MAQQRKIRSAAAVLALTLISGCATCRQYPVACGVATAIVAGSIAVTIENYRDQHGRSHATSNAQPVDCISNPAVCR